VGKKLGFRGATLVSAVLAVASCVRNPATGRLQLNFVSREQEVELGKQGAAEVKSSIGYYQELPRLEGYVQNLGHKLAALSERPKLPWSFHVVDDASVNAFALPGGQIYVTRGILAHLDNEAQLASVLGHEIGHVTARHSANQMSKATLAQAGLGLGALLSDTVAAMLPLGSAGLQLLFLKFSRDHERQSDTLGLRYALRAGYDVREMPKVFAVLKRVSEQGEAGGGKLPSWLATHPDPAERVQYTQARIAKINQNLAGLTVGEASYLAHIDGMAFGENPREGFFKGNTFYQPELAFQVRLPEGWQQQNTKQAVIAASPEGDAALQLTMSAAPNAEAGLQNFFRQSGAIATSQPERIGKGLAASFRASTEDGEIAGRVGYLVEQGRTYEIMGMARPERMPVYQGLMAGVIASFERLTDPEILAVKPKRLEIAKLSQPTPLERVHQEHPALPLEELAIVNQVSRDATLPAGEPVKYVAAATQLTDDSLP
jgi:predicted Zn-dependent protease